MTDDENVQSVSDTDQCVLCGQPVNGGNYVIVKPILGPISLDELPEMDETDGPYCSDCFIKSEGGTRCGVGSDVEQGGSDA